jgi:hypothetical protein
MPTFLRCGDAAPAVSAASAQMAVRQHSSVNRYFVIPFFIPCFLMEYKHNDIFVYIKYFGASNY